jgi:hypothetical protein
MVAPSAASRPVELRIPRATSLPGERAVDWVDQRDRPTAVTGIAHS